MEKAFNEIYDEYSYLVFYVAYDMTHDKELSKDITNEVFMKFYEKRYEMVRAKNVKYYLVKSTKNTCLNYLKKEKPTVELNEDIVGEEETKDNFYELLGKFSEFLDKEELDLLVYRFFYGFKFVDIADLTGVSIDSASGKYRRAIDKIKKYYRGK